MAQRRTSRRASARRRSANDDYEEDDRRYSGRPTNPSMAPVVGIVAVVAVIGVLFAVYANQNKKPAQADGGGGAPAQTAVDPFANVPDEAGPSGISPGGRRTGPVNRSPAELLDDPIWKDAAARANEGYRLDEEAQRAKKDKDEVAYKAKALAARDLFNQLAEDTAIWETEINDTYGDDDRKVVQVKNERDKWFRIIQKYRGL